MPETDYARLVRDAEEAAALRTRRGVRPGGGVARAPGRQDTGAFEQFLADTFIPRTPLDYAMMLGGGGLAKFGLKAGKRIGAAAIGAALAPDEAQAGPAKVAKDVAKVALGAFPTTTPRRILTETKGGGYSVRVPTGERPSEGLMMGVYGNEDPRNLVISGRDPRLADVTAHGTRNIEALQKPERYFGTWRDPETGNTYFDVAQRFMPTDVRQATKFGERTGQISGYNVGAGKTFPVGNWEQFIRGPEFHQRMNRMAEVGGDYLSKFPQREWWDMYGSPFERVYGRQNLPQVAGFTASTAPNTSPIPNLQHMSEYMRRFIRGESVVQPDWRAPEGLMNLAPGRQMPLEASRVLNLQRTERGALDELSRRKVLSEAKAMMGDPNAVVLDRHWARLGEDPSRGIYTSSQEGVISSSPRVNRPSDYELMEREVALAAKREQRDPRDFSADAWTGIRETIQKTGELFGEKFRGSAVLGESKSYGDHFEDLLGQKAAHLRMTKQDLEKRLKGGDASLLSMMLGAPTIGAAYRLWDAERSDPASSADNRASSPAL